MSEGVVEVLTTIMQTGVWFLPPGILEALYS